MHAGCLLRPRYSGERGGRNVEYLARESAPLRAACKCSTLCHQKNYNLKYLGWTASGGRFRIYMKNAPKFTSKGLPDFTGVKLRDNPIYGAFFRGHERDDTPVAFVGGLLGAGEGRR